MTYDILVIGAGPAGLSAAIGARSRNKSVLVIGNPIEDNPLAKSHLVDNYPGLPGVSGLDLLEKLRNHAAQMGTEFMSGRVLAALDFGDRYVLTVGEEMPEGKQLILATGLSRAGGFPGEAEYLGRGVSYCATCDGMLYRGKEVAVVGMCKSAPAEANYLSQIGCKVTYLGKDRPEVLNENIPFLPLKKLAVQGEGVVQFLKVGEEPLPCQGVFILRETVAPTALFPSLELEGNYIKVDREMKTNLPRLYAAGDCTGQPLQVAKAVGEGLIAGEIAAEACE